MTISRRLRTGALLVAVLASAAAFGSSQPVLAAKPNAEAERSLEDAKALLAKGQLKAAEIHLKNALTADSENVEARLALAILYLRGGQPSAAEGTLAPLRSRSELREKVLPILGEALLAQDKAQNLLDALDPNDLPSGTKAQVLVLRSRAYMLRNRTAEAEAELGRALQIDPDQPDALITKASQLLRAGDPAGAEAISQRILTRDPGHIGALLVKGDILRSRGDLQGALDAYNAVLGGRQENPAALLGRAATLISMRRPGGGEAGCRCGAGARAQAPHGPTDACIDPRQ